MPIMQKIMLVCPFFSLGLIIVAVSVILSIAGLLIVKRYISHQKLKTHNDIAGAIFQTLGVAYTVLLAFMVVVAWQNFDRTGLTAESEANYLADLIKDSSAFPADFGEKIRAASYDYAKKVINEEWDMLAEGKESPAAKEALGRISALYTSYDPQNAREEIFLAESVKKLNMLGETRRIRIFESRQGIPALLWLVLVVGALATIIFTFFFGSDNPKAQMLMTSLLSVVIALILYTVLSLDFPFTGGIKVGPDAFLQMLKY